jgi:hypothetical protein
MVVFIAFAGVFAVGGLMITQNIQLASELPRYQATLDQLGVRWP